MPQQLGAAGGRQAGMKHLRAFMYTSRRHCAGAGRQACSQPASLRGTCAGAHALGKPAALHPGGRLFDCSNHFLTSFTLAAAPPHPTPFHISYPQPPHLHTPYRRVQVTSSQLDTKLRDDLERLKKIRWVGLA